MKMLCDQGENRCISIDSCTAFDKTSFSTLAAKLLRYGMVKVGDYKVREKLAGLSGIKGYQVDFFNAGY